MGSENNLLLDEYGRVVSQLIRTGQDTLVKAADDKYVSRILMTLIDLASTKLDMVLGERDVKYFTPEVFEKFQQKCVGERLKVRIVLEGGGALTSFRQISGATFRRLQNGFSLSSELVHFAVMDGSASLVLAGTQGRVSYLCPARHPGITDSCDELFSGLWNNVAVGDDAEVEGRRS